MAWTSATEMGSTPLKGSSISRKRGFVAKARALAAGQGEGRLLRQLLETEVVQLLLGALAARGRGEVQRLDDGHHVLPDRQLAEDGRLLREVAEAGAGPLPHGHGGDVATVEEDAAGGGRHEADDHVESGGLAGAVGPQQADDLAGLQPQADIHHRDLRAVVLGERFDADQTLFAG